MRMWMIPPKHLCNKHLLGEHVECHMLVGALKKKKSVQGYLENGLLEPQNVVTRHNDLIEEMVERGMNHQSPLIIRQVTVDTFPVGEVDIERSYNDLHERCEDCRNLFDRGVINGNTN